MKSNVLFSFAYKIKRFVQFYLHSWVDSAANEVPDRTPKAEELRRGRKVGTGDLEVHGEVYSPAIVTLGFCVGTEMW